MITQLELLLMQFLQLLQLQPQLQHMIMGMQELLLRHMIRARPIISNLWLLQQVILQQITVDGLRYDFNTCVLLFLFDLKV